MQTIAIQRCLNILLGLYVVGGIVALLAGATIVTHVDPFSECLLYSTSQGDKLYYGHEAICEGIGYGYLGVILMSGGMFYVTWKHRQALVTFYKSGVGYINKNEKLLQIQHKAMVLHTCVTGLVLFLTCALTGGYASACNSIGNDITDDLSEKLNNNDDIRRGEELKERFVEDNQFWRYNGEVSNAFGTEFYTPRITCRILFTDPDIHQRLHDTHNEINANYYGYWFKQDLWSFNSQEQAIKTNALIEAALAGGWLSVLVWVGALIFMVLQKKYMAKEKKKEIQADRVSLHSGMEGSMRRGDGSMMSGSGYYRNNTAMAGSFQRGGTRGSDRSTRSFRSRRDMDDLALSVHGIPTPASSRKDINSLGGPTGSLAGVYPGGTPGYPGTATPVYPGYPEGAANQAYPGPHGYNNGAVQGIQGQYPEQVNKMYTTPYVIGAQDTQYVEREHIETEIM